MFDALCVVVLYMVALCCVCWSISYQWRSLRFNRGSPPIVAFSLFLKAIAKLTPLVDLVDELAVGVVLRLFACVAVLYKPWARGNTELRG